MSFNKFISPQTLVVPLGSLFSLYSINTNGLSPTTVTTEDISATPAAQGAKHGPKVVLNKQKILTNIYNKEKLDAMCLCETHQTWYSPPNSSYTESNKLEVNKHGTTVITRLDALDVVREDNISAQKITWENQDMWIISAYFPNRMEDTMVTIQELVKFSRNHKGERVILAGDFNSTRTLASEDAGGTLPPQESRQSKAMQIQEYLSANSFMDLWNTFQNNNRDKEMEHLSHLTHWNHNHTRGARLDRIYANFQIDGVLNVTTRPHPGSDHKAVKLEWSNIPQSGQVQKDPSLPHRTYDLPQVKSLVTTSLAEFTNAPLTMLEILSKWDALKKNIAREACNLWKTHVRNRGKSLRSAEKKLVRSLTTLAGTQLHNPLRPARTKTYRNNWLEWNTIHAQDMEDRRDASSTKYNRISGKTDKDFLAKPRHKSRKIQNMTVDNIRDRPDHPRTNDTDIITKNFVNYYGELYSHKKIDKRPLKRMIGNLDLDLSIEQMDSLNDPISDAEVLDAIFKLPSNKSPGKDRLVYKMYRCAPALAARAITMVANAVTDTRSQPPSWGEVLISVIPKEEDSYSTHKFRPISLLNCDYKIMMRIWADRLGKILADKIGHHQQGFIPGQDGRENIVNVQLIINLINARNDEGAMVFLDQEKAFDMVSFTTIRTIFKDLKWPTRFLNLIYTIYKDNSAQAQVIVNGERSPNTFPIHSGTRQGCPLSPLIFAIVADLFNTTVISNQEFKGHESIKGFFVKISAYADDTGVHLGSLRDIEIYRALLRDYSLATGGVTNLAKSEAVLLGKWRDYPPEIGVRVVEASKYLGVITGSSQALRD